MASNICRTLGRKGTALARFELPLGSMWLSLRQSAVWRLLVSGVELCQSCRTCETGVPTPVIFRRRVSVTAAEADDDGVVWLEVADAGAVFEISVEEEADFQERRRFFLVVGNCFQADRSAVFRQ